MDRTIIRRIIEEKQGHLNKQDLQALRDWMAQSDENKRYVESLQLIWDKSLEYSTDQQFDQITAFQKFKQKTSREPKVFEMKKVSRSSLLKIAASLLFLAMAGTIYFYFSPSNSEQGFAKTTEHKSEAMSLVDGSIVTLNAHTHLNYFKSNEGKNRKLSLNGEGFFEVAKDTDKPFIINTKNLKIEVLGTSFNVRDYEDQNSAEVYVKSGKVKVQAKRSNQLLILIAGESLLLDKQSQSFRKSKTEQLNSMAWLEGKLSFKKTPLLQALNDLEKYFGINISLKNESIKECPYTSLFNNPDKDDILATISAAFDLQLKQEGDKTYYLTGGSCN